MKTLALLAAAALLSGCTIVHVPGKLTYVSPAFGSKTIAKVDLNAGTMEGYKTDQVQMTEAIAAGVAAGLKLKP